MVTGMVLATVENRSQFTDKAGKVHSATDKNNAQNVMLKVISGKAPNRLFLSGTIAQRTGLVVGKTYLLNYNEAEADAFGRRINWSKIAEASVMDVLQGSTLLGKAEIFNIDEIATPVTKTTEQAIEDLSLVH